MTWLRRSFLCHGKRCFMPIYDYICEVCGKEVIDVIQRMDDPPLEFCPMCGGHIRRMVTSANFVLKGEGGYKPSPSKDEKD